MRAVENSGDGDPTEAVDAPPSSAASFLQTCGAGLRPDLLPAVVSRFIEREAPFESDAQYFEALLALHATQERVRRLNDSVAGVFKSSAKQFADPASDFYERGRELRAAFQNLAGKLDQKRRDLLERMKSPPIIEAFLDAMEASDAERRLFYTVVVSASKWRKEPSALMSILVLEVSTSFSSSIVRFCSGGRVECGQRY